MHARDLRIIHTSQAADFDSGPPPRDTILSESPLTLTILKHPSEPETEQRTVWVWVWFDLSLSVSAIENYQMCVVSLQQEAWSVRLLSTWSHSQFDSKSQSCHHTVSYVKHSNSEITIPIPTLRALLLLSDSSQSSVTHSIIIQQQQHWVRAPPYWHHLFFYATITTQDRL